MDAGSLKCSTRRALLPRHTRARARHARAARLCCAIYAFLSNVASARSDAAEADAARRGRGGQRVGVAARRMDDARCLVSSSTAERHVATVETETVARYKARRATAGSCEIRHSVRCRARARMHPIRYVHTVGPRRGRGARGPRHVTTRAAAQKLSIRSRAARLRKNIAHAP